MTQYSQRPIHLLSWLRFWYWEMQSCIDRTSFNATLGTPSSGHGSGIERSDYCQGTRDDGTQMQFLVGLNCSDAVDTLVPPQTTNIFGLSSAWDSGYNWLSLLKHVNIHNPADFSTRANNVGWPIGPARWRQPESEKHNLFIAHKHNRINFHDGAKWRGNQLFNGTRLAILPDLLLHWLAFSKHWAERETQNT